MPEENVNPAWVAQTSQTSQWSWSQPWDDFVIDFWEGTSENVDELDTNADIQQESENDLSPEIQSDSENSETWDGDDFSFSDDLFWWEENESDNADADLQDFSQNEEMDLDEESDWDSNAEQESFVTELENTQPESESFEMDEPIIEEDSQSIWDTAETSEENNESSEENNEWFENNMESFEEDKELFDNVDESLENETDLAEEDAESAETAADNYENDFENVDMPEENVDVELNPENDLDGDSDVDLESDLDVNEESDIDLNTESDVDSDVDLNEESEVDSETDTEINSTLDWESDLESDLDSDVDSTIDWEADLDSEADSDNFESENEEIFEDSQKDSPNMEENNESFDENLDNDSDTEDQAFQDESITTESMFQDNEWEYQDVDLINYNAENLENEVLDQDTDTQWEQNPDMEMSLEPQVEDISSTDLPSNENISEPSFAYDMNAELTNTDPENSDWSVVENSDWNTEENAPQAPLETAVSLENSTDGQQIQSTLSLDQILDTELQVGNQTTLDTTNTWSDSWSSKKSILPIVIWAGVLALAAVVALMAFPTLLSNVWNEKSDDWEATHWTYLESNTNDSAFEYAPELDQNELINDDPDFPDPVDNGDELANQENDLWNYLPADPNTTGNPKPFNPSNVDVIDDSNLDDGMISEEEILLAISSFKSEGEQYYQYGQDRLDREIIRYASKIVYLCDEYQWRVLQWEWLDSESFDDFNTSVLDIINKIRESYNSPFDGESIAQSDFNSESSYFEGREQIESYIYNR